MNNTKLTLKNKLRFNAPLLMATLFSLILTATQSTSAEIYTVTELGTPGGGYFATAINNAGQVTGSFSTNPNSILVHAFLYSNGTMQDLGVLAGNYSAGNAINDVGQVAGNYGVYGAGLGGHDYANAFIYTNGIMQNLGTLGGDFSYAYGINNVGQVVGSSLAGDNTFHSFLYSDGKMHDINSGAYSMATGINDAGLVIGSADYHAFLYENGAIRYLGTLGGGMSSAASINNAGQVVGAADTREYNSHAFLYENGVMQDLGTLGGVASFASDINNLGQVVGASYTADGSIRPFLYEDGIMKDLLSVFDTSWSWPEGENSIFINDSGQIAGTATHNGRRASFLLTPDMPAPAPVPEPSTLFLLGSGVAFLWIKRLRFAERNEVS